MEFFGKGVPFIPDFFHEPKIKILESFRHIFITQREKKRSLIKSK